MIGVAAGLGAVGCLVGASVLTIFGMTAKAQQPRPIPNSMEPTVPFEYVEWTSGGGKVRGWMLPQPGAGKSPAVLVAHGWGSNRARVLRFAIPLHEAGFAVLMYDARSHGESEKHPAPTGLMFRDDLLAALEWLRNRADIDTGRVGVLGHSLGGFGAVLALAEGAPIAALVTDSMPVKFDTMIGAELSRRKLPRYPLAHVIPRIMAMRSGISRSIMKKADPAKILADNLKGRNIPVLLVHSRGDGYIPSTELDHVLLNNPQLPHLYVDVSGHSSSEQDPAFWPAVLGFFQTHLGMNKENRLAASAASPSREIY
ncbi:alpha/beta fold hydrolase [Cohnella pontilimi]|uniref:Alpha/beta fold hydrolase n=1 Tax=Cohnella pontilimi TaxID=2564100 RepID=A0A4V5LSE7_9BACL|nr:alpha/beta fold hydrolase [Cohnella pontilimi]TJY42799.1 alpha/beta fold hydrolase [Cohnella pontilimi]